VLQLVLQLFVLFWSLVNAGGVWLLALRLVSLTVTVTLLCCAMSEAFTECFETPSMNI
jgi:hypothetical protein